MRIIGTLPFAVVIALTGIQGALTAAEKQTEPKAPPEALAKWRDLRFGMFIHWGPVSLKGTEIGWSRGAQIPIEEYDNLYKKFNPSKFDADQWVKIAKDAGMKYIVFTTKHHDGFCMFDTKQTDYNLMNSPFGRDVTKELARACRKQGIKFGTYHSVCDWHNSDFTFGSPGGEPRKPNPDMDRYEEYLTKQVEELIRNYGPLLTMWFDMPQDFGGIRGARIVEKVRALQPDILVNNRSGAPHVADYETPEQRIGETQEKPWETCMTICTQWAWKPDDKLKSLKECLQTLVKVVGGDGNLLLNVGPMPDGRIEQRQAERLREMGRWLAKYGESIYGTRGGPFERGQWGAATMKGDTIYLHLLDPNLDEVKLAPLRRKIVETRVLTGGTATVKNDDVALRVSVPKSDRQEIDTIVALKLDGPAADAVVKPWNLEELFKPPRILEEKDSDVEAVKAIKYVGPMLRGKPSQLNAYYGIPKVEPGKKVPAFVLVYGETKPDLAKWVKRCMDRGYAAIALDPSPIDYDETDLPLHDKMICQGVAEIILSHSLIRSLPQVDGERVGIIGFSFGGCVACIAAGVDPRFSFAVPVYCCGSFDQYSNNGEEIFSKGAIEANYWLGLWDPAIYLRDVKIPMLWVSCTNDAWFPLNSLQDSYRLPRAPRTLSVRIGKPLKESDAMQLKEIEVFTDAQCRGGVPPQEVSIRRRNGLQVGVRFRSKTPIVKVELNYTTDAGPWQKRKWRTIETAVDLAAGTASGALPDGATAYFFNVIDRRGLVVSSEHFHVPRP